MDLVTLKKLKRPELIDIAGHFDVKRRHRMRKRDLIKALTPCLGEIPERLSAAEKRPDRAESSTLAAPQPQPSTGYIDRGKPIPDHYGLDRIVALVRDPNCLYVYWELEGPQKDVIRGEHGDGVFDNGSWMLRIISDRGGEGEYVPIVPDAANWYLPVAENSTYVVEIGIVPQQGRFIRLAASNRVHTPRTGVSPDTTCEWMRVDEDFVASPIHRGAVGTTFADALSERFAVPGMSSRFLGGSEHVSGSGHMKKK